MKGNLYYVNGFHKTDNNQPLWKWKRLNLTKNEEKGLSISEFLHEHGRKIDESVLGPGVGVGVGCGIGFGLGLIGGVGYGGSEWNPVRMVFGFGMGCGVGVGFGYGQGFGLGSSWERLRNRVLKPNPEGKKRILIQI